MSSNSSRSSSPSSTLFPNTITVFTPSRKVQALLAQFSDSDADDDGPHIESVKTSGINSGLAPSTSKDAESEDEEEEIIPRGRMAARLLGTSRVHEYETQAGGLNKDEVTRPGPRSSPPAIDTDKRAEAEVEVEVEVQRSNQQFTASPARQGGLVNDHLSSDEEATVKRRECRDLSPLFFPSPQRSPHRNNAAQPPPQADNSGRSRFLALVEKRRKERLLKEAAEVANRAAGISDEEAHVPKRVRGSSPADDSSEGSGSADDEAARRIQKQARPTRKASKKALEEMNRETQRMSRNMQLTHQARTKKKITKESLLARFSRTVDDMGASIGHIGTKDVAQSSSATTSDGETAKGHQSTPPTSPVHVPSTPKRSAEVATMQEIMPVPSTEHAVAEMYGAVADGDDIANIESLVDRKSSSEFAQKLLDYSMNDTSVRSPVAKKERFTASTERQHGKRNYPSSYAQSTRQSHVRRYLVGANGSDSDEEIEIVEERGLKRKYAAFETLPKRKAKETPSHLALRSLAHITADDNKKQSMNTAQLEANLRKRARLQALEERRQKIEDLRARGIVIQTTEERERDQQDVEDLVERARQEAADIQKREKEVAKKDGTYVKDDLDDEDDESEDADFEEQIGDSDASGSENDDDENVSDLESPKNALTDDEVDEVESEDEHEHKDSGDDADEVKSASRETKIESSDQMRQHSRRRKFVVSDDEEDEASHDLLHLSPPLPVLAKTPQSVFRSARKPIPGLQMSDDLPMGLSQAFAATLAESQTQDFVDTQEQESFNLTADLPSPKFANIPLLQRHDSVDLISDSQPSGSQTQPLNVNLLSQSQPVPPSPRGLGIHSTQYTPSQRQMPFELTQDNGYILSPFTGNRFADSPSFDGPHSTVETLLLAMEVENSPVLQRRGRLQRGRTGAKDDLHNGPTDDITAFEIMRQAAQKNVTPQEFNKKKSTARNIVDEAAEESEDEYAGLGGASDDSGDDEENEDDRQMIDEDTQVGRGDAAKLAGLYADRERDRDEKEVSKLLKDITTGALRRKRGIGDDLDLSDEEDAAARRREVKRREFARMRRELLKDEAVGKIAEDKKKEAFLRSIEDHEVAEDDDEDDGLGRSETVPNSTSQGQSQGEQMVVANSQQDAQDVVPISNVLSTAPASRLNRQSGTHQRVNPAFVRKPATLAEIRDSVSFLIEEPESQAAIVDLGLSDSEEDPEAYVDLDRHFRDAEADENDLEDADGDDLGGFVIDDELNGKASQDGVFKKPDLPRQERAPFHERRTKHNEVVDRLSLIRQSSSSASSTTSASSSSKMAFFSARTGASYSGAPTLLRRATTNSSLGSRSGRENISATGVVTSKTERGNAAEEKEFIRKGSGGRRNAVNYQAERKTLREEKMSARAGIVKAGKGKKGHGFLGGLFRGDSWN